MFSYDTSWRRHKYKICILIFGGYCMNKTKNFLFEIKGFLDGTFEKLANITLENKMCMSRILYVFLLPLLLLYVMSPSPCFHIEKLLLMEAIFMGIVCFFFRLSLRKGFMLLGIFLIMSFLFTKFVGNTLVFAFLKMFSINEVYRFLVYCFATGAIFLLFGEGFLRIVGKAMSNNCNFKKKNSDGLLKV